MAELALTARESCALDAIKAFITEHGFPPSTRELATALGTWPSWAGRLLGSLEVKGRIRCVRGRCRTLVVLAERAVAP